MHRDGFVAGEGQEVPARDMPKISFIDSRIALLFHILYYYYDTAYIYNIGTLTRIKLCYSDEGVNGILYYYAIIIIYAVVLCIGKRERWTNLAHHTHHPRPKHNPLIGRDEL